MNKCVVHSAVVARIVERSLEVVSCGDDKWLVCGDLDTGHGIVEWHVWVSA